jgi:hypothetical protein
MPKYQTLLSDEAQTRSDLDDLIQKAEWHVVDRYREVRPAQGYHRPVLDGSAEAGMGAVQLRGWAEGADGKPDTAEMDAGLLRRLRIVIATLVDAWVEADRPTGIQSVTQGARRVTYFDPSQTPDVPAGLYRPLRPFDDRAGWH